MDHATLTDNMGKKADFRNVILIMTSNAGAREMATSSIGFGTGVHDSKHKSLKAIEKAFTPEFRNRLDAIVSFNALPLAITEQIVDKFVRQLEAQLLARKVVLTLTDPARRWLAENGCDEKFGARPLGRLIEQKIETPLADELLFGRLEKGGAVAVDLKEDELVLRIK
jgi:ATP-dependent Clp protease ATP-binding subunit ClpA